MAIVSRGYGGQARRATLVGATQSPNVAAASTDVRIVGDESLVLARRFDGPVFVAARRAEAGALACELGADVLVLDDGFQHLALGRDFDLVCIRPSTPGADRVLPAGRLREPPSAIARADAVLLVGAGAERLDPAIRQRLGTIPVHRGELRAIGLVTPDGEGWRNLPMGILSARRSLGLAGLADVEPFYKTLHDWEARLEDFLEFPDHHDYTLDDWKKIAYRSRELDLVVTTEKDLVKLERFPFAKDKLVAVRVSIEVEAEDRLLDQVTAAIERRRGELGAGDQRS